MKRTIISIISIIIVIGVIGLSLNVALGRNTVAYLDRVRVEESGLYIYKFNTWSYIENLKLSVGTITKLTLEIPSRQWQWATGLNDFFSAFANDLCVIVDYIIFLINILIYPIRIGAYLLKNLLALVGINMTQTDKNGLWWLVQLTNWLIERVAIPYIN